MNYKTVYNETKVLTSTENGEISNITTTSSPESFIIDTIPQTFKRLQAWGIDVSYFWRNELHPRIEPAEEELAISDHPLEPNVTRKAFVYTLAINFEQREFRFNTIVRHFDQDGAHLTGEIDDVFVSRLVNNDNKVDDGQGNQIGEFDYFYGALVSGAATLIEMQQARIPIMDANGIYNDGIYL